jgi:hypothetical protein
MSRVSTALFILLPCSFFAGRTLICFVSVIHRGASPAHPVAKATFLFNVFGSLGEGFVTGKPGICHHAGDSLLTAFVLRGEFVDIPAASIKRGVGG